MKLTLACPYAKYNSEMQIICSKLAGPCAHQFYRECKGWWALTQQAADCPARKETTTNGKAKTAKKRSNKV